MIQKIITDIKEAEDKKILKNAGGAYFVDTVTGKALFVPLWYGNRLDLERMLLYTGNDIDLHPDIPDYNDLVKTGRIKLRKIFKEHDIFLKKYRSCDEAPELSEEDIQAIIEEFHKNGFNVTRRAILHNYDAWLSDFKSGYRDKKNGYHLFTPCGCNPLSFRASSLDARVDFQDTYEA